MLKPATFGLATAVALSAAVAQTTPNSDCLDKWKNADANRNGVLEPGEVGGGTGDATQLTTREDYLATCMAKTATPGMPDSAANDPRDAKKDSGTAATGASTGAAGDGAAVKQAFPKDLGTGDLTKGKSPFDEGAARKRLEELGFKDVQELKLAEDGIWRGIAVAGGDRKTVALDAQGDIVAQ